MTAKSKSKNKKQEQRCCVVKSRDVKWGVEKERSLTMELVPSFPTDALSRARALPWGIATGVYASGTIRCVYCPLIDLNVENKGSRTTARPRVIRGQMKTDIEECVKELNAMQNANRTNYIYSGNLSW